MQRPLFLMPVQNLLLQLVRQAGTLLRQQVGKVHQVRYKSEKNLVTEMDQRVETLFLRAVSRHFPEHEVLSEEMEEEARGEGWSRPAGRGRVRWIIDPLDGTTNYAHGFPHFSVSAGVEYQGRIVLGAVFNPMLSELFFARQGQGASLNGKPIRVSRVRRLEHALLATGFPYDLKTSRINNFAEFKRVSQHCQAVRRAGSASLDLCDVACGRFDGFWEYKLKPWDVAAASLIVQEAGGRISNFSGPGLNIYGGSFIAGNCQVYPGLRKVLTTRT